MNAHVPPTNRPTYEQLNNIIRQCEAVDRALKGDLDGLAAVAWLAHHAYGSTKPGYVEEDYEAYASEAFRFVSSYLTDRVDSFTRDKITVVDLELGDTDGEASHA